MKNIVTFLPLAAAPFAIMKDAIALSKSPLKTTIELPSGFEMLVGDVAANEEAASSCSIPLRSKASIIPLSFFFTSSN
ncbi:hypothetical protein D3C81_1613960 [compost metagenome]